jgi:hypothetical protein
MLKSPKTFGVRRLEVNVGTILIYVVIGDKTEGAMLDESI